VLSLLNTTFWTASQTLGVGNPLALLFVFVGYVALVVAVLSKCCTAIYVIPDGVMVWLGHRAQGDRGEAEAMRDMKSGVSKAATAATKQLEGMVKGGGEIAAKRGEANKGSDALLGSDAEAPGKGDGEGGGNDAGNPPAGGD
jgi:hypothetical protein